MSDRFSYAAAFSRNIGWLAPHEQEALRYKRVAIAGLGGVGGAHLLTLARLGIGAFNLADFDTFELPNFNRQSGASMSTLGQSKIETMAAAAKDINPELALRLFPEGITPANIPEFLSGVDLYVDGLDFFAFPAREAIFQACAEFGVPAITVAPLGMGAALLNFLPGGMTFEEYFRLTGLPEAEKMVRFLLGLSPAMLQRRYVADPSTVDFARHRGPSTAMACQLCAGVAATEALKILLKRGKIHAAPHGVHFDAYRNQLKHTWRPWGNHHPIQRIAIAIARKQLAAMAAEAKPFEALPAAAGEIEQILDLARWAPSGDNTQPWRFEIADHRHIVVHGFDTRSHCIYDLDGRSSQIAIGALLENIRIAASGQGLRTEIRRRTDAPEENPVFDAYLAADPALAPDPLIPAIPVRSVQRRPLRTQALTAREKEALEAAAGESCSVLWIEGWAAKWKVARLLWKNAKLRLTLPEAYRVHRDIIEWNARFSQDKVPDQAVGLDPLTTRLMRWVMQSWGRVGFFNTYLGGTVLPRVELDLVPALACAGHFLILAREAPKTIDDYIAAGQAMQRFWLTATKLGLQLQPEMTPLIFSRYARTGIEFSLAPRARDAADSIRAQFEAALGPHTGNAVFMGRIGSGPAARARSLRLPLSRLLSS